VVFLTFKFGKDSVYVDHEKIHAIQE